jgi:hypothetical protein
MTFQLAIPRYVSFRRRRHVAGGVPSETSDQTTEVVVCKVDGSPSGSEAARAAIAQCLRSGAALKLVCTLNRTPLNGFPLSTPQRTLEEQVCRVREAQRALIKATRSAEEAGIPVTVSQHCC